MERKNVRTPAALLVVVVALLAASLACYSGQVPGVLELTPYYTETPLPSPEESRFEVGDTAFTAQENSAFFYLTTHPEPLAESQANSKALCEPNVSAQVLFAGLADDGHTYYLVECNGAAGWAAESRLAGPLLFADGDLALTLAAEGERNVEMLDLVTFQPMFFQTCTPGMITQVSEIQARDIDDDGLKDVFYQIECPTGNRGWVTNADLFGPLEINVGDRALAISPEGEDRAQGYRLASEPAELTEENTLTDESCQYGSVIEAQEARLVGEQVYYRLTCGTLDGWATQDRFVGPLRFDEGMNTVIFMPPIPVFIDDLPQETEGEVIVEAVEGEEGAVEGEEAPVEEAAVEDPLAEDPLATGEEEGQRRVVQVIPPLYLTNSPAVAIPEGEGSNVVGQCASGQIASILEYTGTDGVYYRVTCDECVETETNADGEEICAARETREGWADQQYLQGPLDFLPGERVMMEAAGEDDAGNPVLLIPSVPTYIIGSNTRFSGRCPVEDGVEITDVRLEKDRTRDSYTVYYQIQCQGDAASYVAVRGESQTRFEVQFNTGSQDTVVGWAAQRDLMPIEE